MTQGKSAISLIAVDLDGTLLTSRAVLASEGSRLLKAAARNGVHVVLATSRIIHSTRDLCRSLELTTPVICTSGAQIYDSIDGPAWKSSPFPKEIAQEVAILADAHGWGLSITIGDVTYYRQRPGSALGPFAPGRAVVATNVDAVTDNPIRILVNDPAAAREILAFCRPRFSDRCLIEPYHNRDGEITSLGIFSIDVNKGSGLDLVLRRLNVIQSEVMVIGDDLNDLPMFARARVKIAMGNAQAELKEHATAVAPSNDDEGVAWALKEFGVAS